MDLENGTADAENDINLSNTTNSFSTDDLKPKENNQPSVELPNSMDKDDDDETIFKSKSIAVNNRQILTDSDDDNNENTRNDKSHQDSNNSNDFLKITQTPDEDDEGLVKNRKRIDRNNLLEDSDSSQENKDLGTYKKSGEEVNNSNKSASENSDDGDLELKKTKRRKVRKRVSALDSDSSDDEVPESNNSQKAFVNRGAEITHQSYLSDGDDSNNVELRTNSEETAASVNVVEFVSEKSRLKALCDSDSSGCEADDDDNKSPMTRESTPMEEHEENEHPKPLPYKKKSKSKTLENEKPKKMTGKEATELRQEIKAENQRMLRASNVSLPYHKPKSYSLKEFLERRSKFTPTSITSAKTTSVAIKMSKEELTIFTKRLKEREKEAKEFFKSESESEGEEVEKPGIEENINGNQNETNLGVPNVATNENLAANEFNLAHGKDEMVSLPDDIFSKTEDSEEILNRTDDEKITIENGTLDAADSIIEGNAFPEKTLDSTKDTLIILSEREKEICENNVKSSTNDENSPSSDICATETVEELSNLSNAADIDAYAMEVENNTGNEFKISTPTSNNYCQVQTRESSNTEQSEKAKPIEETINKINIISNIIVSTNNSLGSLNESDNLHNTEKDNKTIADDLDSEMNDDFSSTDYQFNLDDFEEDSPDQSEVIFSNRDKPAEGTLTDEAFKNENNAPYKKSFYSLDENTTEEEIIEGKKSKIELLKEKFAHIKPKLSGGPDQMIDLTEKPTLPINVAALKERFIKHLTRHDHHNHKVDVSVVSVSDAGEVQKEILKMNITEEEIPIVVNEKPGEKLKKLRTELQIQMAKRRSEMWQQKVSGAESAIEKDDDEKSQCGADDDLLDDEVEEDLTEESSEEDEEMDFDDMETIMKDKPVVRSAFVDDEADESEIENENTENESDGDDKNALEDDDVELAENEVEDEQSNNTKDQAFKKPKGLRRIIRAFTEDSDDDSQDEDLPQLVQKDNFVTTLPEQTLELVENDDDDDDFLTPYQNPPSQTRQKQDKAESESFLTPVSYFTGIQSLNSASKKKNPVSPLRAIAVEPSPLKDKNWESELQKKLYADSVEPEFESQVNSSQFTQESVNRQLFTDEDQNTQNDSSNFNEIDTLSQADDNFNTSSSSDKYANPVVENTTQDLLAVCSGNFTGITQAVPNEITGGELNGSSSIAHLNHTLLDNATVVSLSDENKESKILDEEQNQLISQLLDEEEMEKFKKRFVSPPAVRNKSSKVMFDLGDEVRGGAGVIDSDEENEELLIKSKKKQKKLVFSDDEDSSEGENDSIKDEEEISLCDNSGNDSEDDEVQVGDTKFKEQNIEYDSEENEIEGIPSGGHQNDRQDGGYTASDFFENEAELSESEWDSADEDERGLDEMDFELADKEKFDEEKVRTDLEKIHMRRMLDEDNREVKILQELLLDDGELHGAGRQRQFRWKNIDSVGVEEEGKKDDDQEIYIEENESEEQWRKMRYQREQFLRNKSSQSSIEVEAESISCSSQLFSVSKVIIKTVTKSEHNTPTNTQDKTDDVSKTPETTKQPFALLNKRGSFLSRGEQVLQKLAEYTKGAVSSSNTFSNIKPSKNFIFQTVRQESDSTGFNQGSKRKAVDNTPINIKKLRLSSGLSPANQKKSLAKPDRAKKLF